MYIHSCASYSQHQHSPIRSLIVTGTYQTYQKTKQRAMLRTLGQAAAKALDVDLMTQPGFSLDQLMELAGLSVACAIAAEYGHLGMSSSDVCGGR